MANSHHFRELIVWQKAHQFVLGVYKLTEQFPKSELYALTSQFRRAAVSITANIVEGYRKSSEKEKLHFLNIAQGSASECEYYLILAQDLGYGDTQILIRILEEVHKLIYAYANAVRKG